MDDLSCGAPSTLGCSVSGCCFERPTIGNVNPVDSATDVCLNAAVWVEFDQLMDAGSLDGSVDANADGIIDQVEILE